MTPHPLCSNSRITPAHWEGVDPVTRWNFVSGIKIPLCFFSWNQKHLGALYELFKTLCFHGCLMLLERVFETISKISCQFRPSSCTLLDTHTLVCVSFATFFIYRFDGQNDPKNRHHKNRNRSRLAILSRLIWVVTLMDILPWRRTL